ncbi:hypothetical protein [Thomasclavelia cocleata]|jgi:hypothetical protein|uniref:YqfQ-like protein n=2 Tax=Thomasclavelia cocleata TaxID=69824 RepID=A0A1I0DHR2_9FIRM|nr:hypothetical protein [Thomasclavelia cocleata]MCI9131090.1 hypothetical protein [Thomasclavelia cocleata]MCI9630095.1 hypothetical protein [Thomasclavelia cocleata]MCR1961128.1 hypothetical protein [Thomasclavelia cocleata]NDO42650.1 hypothetical protein [Thomasclavelia cocleata]PJN80440.1 hypothetical protein CWE04_08380 [Thomasclavelia cocleata]
MNPFYDENFYYDNFNPQIYSMNQINPLDRKMKTKMNLRKSIHYASKTIYTINQVIPLIYQIRPIINNTKNAFRVIQAVNHINDINFDEVEQNITPINENQTKNTTNDDVEFENMIQ